MRSLLLTGFILLFSTGAFPQGSSPPNGLVAFETLTLAPAADAMQAGVLAGVMTTETVLFATVSAPLSHNLGIAIVNPGAIPANVTMTLRLASDGTAISVKTLAIRARQQVANFIGEFFADVPEFPADFDASLSIISDNPVAILAMRFLGTNFSTIPITSLSSPATVPQIDTGVGGPGAVILPQFATGGSWSSEIVVLNTTARALAVRVDLFKQDGTPLTASFNGKSGSSFQNRVVRANSVLIERTDNTGILQVGYAIVTPVNTIAGTVVPRPMLTVTSTDPSNGATGVTPNKNIVAAFSEAMNPLTFTPLTFTVKQGLIPITGVVTYSGLAATFSPSSNLAAGLIYTATITTGAKDSAGNALSNNFVWSFTTDNAINTIAPPVVAKVSLVTSLNLAGSFVAPQSVYADSDRIYLGSYQGYLFVLGRDRSRNFPLIQTIAIGSPLTTITGDNDSLYIAGRDGNLYVYNKSWPLQFVRSVTLSNYGLSALDVIGKHLYAAVGQASMVATADRLYLSALNPGDFAIDVGTQRNYGKEEFVAATILVFDTTTGKQISALRNPIVGVNISAWGPFIYLTNPGCCSSGVYIYDAATLSLAQLLGRSTNVVAGTRNNSGPLLVGGSERGGIDLYALGQSGYRLNNSIDLPAMTGFNGPEDIEIRALWADGFDDLVFAASSGGNDQSRARGGLPTFFVLAIQ